MRTETEQSPRAEVTSAPVWCLSGLNANGGVEMRSLGSEGRCTWLGRLHMQRPGGRAELGSFIQRCEGSWGAGSG